MFDFAGIRTGNSGWANTEFISLMNWALGYVPAQGQALLSSDDKVRYLHVACQSLKFSEPVAAMEGNKSTASCLATSCEQAGVMERKTTARRASSSVVGQPAARKRRRLPPFNARNLSRNSHSDARVGTVGTACVGSKSTRVIPTGFAHGSSVFSVIVP
jgi:hypothetical protein